MLLIMCCDLEVTDRRMTPAIKLVSLNLSRFVGGRNDQNM